MNLSYRLGWWSFRQFYRFYFHWDIVHPERIPATGAAILAGNHASFLDPPLIGACTTRPLYYLARDTLFRLPGFAQLLHSWNAVPVDREGGGASGIKGMLQLLQSGAAIIVFPEGTRTRDGRFQPAHSGIGLLVVKTRVPVIPVRISGTYEAFGRRMWFPKPGPIKVHFGEPLRFDALLAEATVSPRSRHREIYQQIADEVMSAIASLDCPKPPPEPS
jgi:1-acyl-sn-glycerol-3-phosphate acyltransferase